MPKNLAAFEDQIADMAEALAERLVGMDRFDAIRDFAQALPLAFVTELIGLPSEGMRLGP